MSILHNPRVLSFWGYGKPLFYVSALSSMMNLKCVRKPRFTHATKQKNVWILPNPAIASMVIDASSSTLYPKPKHKPEIENAPEVIVLHLPVTSKIKPIMLKSIEKTCNYLLTSELIFFARRLYFISGISVTPVHEWDSRQMKVWGRWICWRPASGRREYTLCDLIIASKIKFHFENKYNSFPSNTFSLIIKHPKSVIFILTVYIIGNHLIPSRR